MSNPRRFQFSLKTLMLVVLGGGGLAVMIFQRYENSRLQEKVRTLRNEAGYLTIGDPAKIWARAAKTNTPLKHIFRIYIPEEMDFRIGAVGKEIPGVGYEPHWTGGSRGHAKKGETLTVEVDVTRDLKGDLRAAVTMGAGKSYVPLAPPPSGRDWPGEMWTTTGVMPAGGSVQFSIDKPFDLLRIRSELPGGEAPSNDFRATGLLVFFVPHYSDTKHFGGK